MQEKEITLEIRHPEIIFLLVVLVAFFILELKVTFNSPIAFGDEAGHTFLAKWIGEKKEFIVKAPLYGGKLLGWNFERPPLFHLLQASFYFLFGFNEGIVKFLVPFTAFLTGLAIFLLGSKIFSREVALVAAIISVTIPSFVTYSVLFYESILHVFYFTLGALFTFLAIKTNEKKHWILASVFLSFSFLTKTPGYLIFPFLFSIFAFQIFEKRNFFEVFKQFLIPSLIIFLLIIPFFLRGYYYYGKLGPFQIKEKKPPYEYQLKYHFEKRVMPGEVTFFEHGIMGYLDFAYGNVWFVPLTFICGLLLILFYRKKEEILLFILLSLFLIIFYQTYKGRTEDMARYLLGSTPFVALVSSMYIVGLSNWLSSFFKKYSTYIIAVIIILTIIFSYMNLQMKLNIMKRVKQFLPSFFEACDWVKNNLPKDAVLFSLWGHQTVYHCERNSMFDMPELDDVMLGQDLNLTLSRLKFHGVTHIFLQKPNIINERYSQGYWIGFVELLERNPQVFIPVYENGPSFNLTNRDINRWIRLCISRIGTICDGTVIYELNYTI